MPTSIFGREPAAIAAFLSIAVNLAITFGLHLTIEQVALVNALIVAGLALIVRQSVTPTASPQLPVGTTVTTPATATAPEGSATVIGNTAPAA